MKDQLAEPICIYLKSVWCFLYRCLYTKHSSDARTHWLGHQQGIVAFCGCILFGIPKILLHYAQPCPFQDKSEKVCLLILHIVLSPKLLKRRKKWK